MSAAECPVRLAQAGQALEGLLDGLLTSEPEPARPPVRRQAVTPPVPEVLPAGVVAVESESPGTPAEKPSSVRPGWAEGEIKLLPVHLDRLCLLVPLCSLDAIVRPEPGQAPVRLPGQPDWHRGVESFRGQRLVCVDPVALLGLSVQRGETGYLLVTGGSRYGIEIDAMGEPFNVDADEVCWRGRNRGREWALGLLPQRKAVLLDLEALVARLASKTGTEPAKN